MNALTWNVKGLREERKLAELLRLSKENNLGIYAFKKLKCRGISNIESIPLNNSFDHFIFSPHLGKSGGLLLAWKDSSIEVLST